MPSNADQPDEINDRFHNFDPGASMPPLPPAEIRRRGDRLRRRNTGLVAAGAAAAVVAAVAIPIALTSGSTSSDRGVRPADTPTVTVTEPTPAPSPTEGGIPADFPLTDGYPEVNGDDGSPVATTDEPGIGRIEQCGDSVWTPGGPRAETIDVAGATYTGEAEDSRARTLALYATSEDAAAALNGIREDLNDCPVDGTEGTEGTDQVFTEVEGSQTSEGLVSSTFTHRYRFEGNFDTGLEVLQLAQVGPALYLASYYGEGGGSAETIESSVERASEDSAGVIAAMVSAFGGAGEESEPTGDPQGDAALLADVPLASGFPDDSSAEPGAAYGLSGPSASLPAAELYDACYRALGFPSTTAVLRATWENVEDYRTREVYTFGSADDAVAFMGGARALYEACPDVPDDGGLSTSSTYIPTTVAGQSFAVARSAQVDGEPAIGLQVLHFVRLGRAVLIDTRSGEGLLTPRTDLEALLEPQIAAATDVVAAMCSFTEAGC